MSAILPSLWLLALMVLAHFACDYQFQSSDVAVGKGKFAGGLNGVDWYYWMASHAAVHALAVCLITRNPLATLGEFVLHFAVDWGKCKRYFGLHVDQLLHVLCKVAWAALLCATAA